MKAEDFGKMIKKFFRSLRKNFIDIKFLSISILVLLFASLLVFKPKRGFLEGVETMGDDKFIEGEATVEKQEEEEEVSELLKDSVIDPVVEEDIVPIVEDEEPVVPDLTQPCSLCGVECPNKENACMASKPSCIKCAEEIQEKMEKKSSQNIVVNVYTGGSGPSGIETTSILPGMKGKDMMSSLGYGTTASSNAVDGLLGTISDADLKESEEFNDIMKEKKEKEQVKASEAPVFPMTNGSEASEDTTDDIDIVESFTLIPSFMRSKQSYSLPNSTQRDIDLMNNI